MATSWKNYRKRTNRQGAAYERFIEGKLKEYLGITIHPNKGRTAQLWGENAEGIEIKNDDLLKKTGNVYIEIAEKAMPREGDYYPSGIYRQDNSTLYLVGDYTVAFIFKKKQLQKMWKNKYPGLVFRQTATSQGFTMPKASAILTAERVLYF